MIFSPILIDKIMTIINTSNIPIISQSFNDYSIVESNLFHKDNDFYIELGIHFPDYETIQIPLNDDGVIQYLLNIFLLYNNFYIYNFYTHNVHEVSLNEMENFINHPEIYNSY